MPDHVMAVPMLDRGGAADRLRNHLRRRAITRLGLITGDLYFLPYRRASGDGPEGETTFSLIAAETGDPRLLRVDLPPADLKPFDPGSIPEGARVLRASIEEGALRERGAAIGWKVRALEDLIHYPFWLMRVEDSSRFEGAWIDAVEGKIIHHTLKVPPPVPSMRESAIVLGAPAALMAFAALALDGPARAGAAFVASAVAVPAITAWLSRRARKEREG